MSVLRRWWAICGSDPAWWTVLPVVALVTAVCGPLWVAAWIGRRMGDAAEWFYETVGATAARWIGSVYGPRRERRVQAWRKATGAPTPVHPHIVALRGLSQRLSERPKAGDE